MVALSDLSGEFQAMYAPFGRPSIPPEKLLRASLLPGVLHDPLGTAADGTAGSSTCCFAGLSVWPSTMRLMGITRCSQKNRDRLLEGEIAAKFMVSVLTQPERQAASVKRSLLSRWHTGGSLGQHEEASQAEERGSRTTGWQVGATKRSTSEARRGATRPTPPPVIPTPCSIAKGSGMEAKLCFIGHAAWMENRHGALR